MPGGRVAAGLERRSAGEASHGSPAGYLHADEHGRDDGRVRSHILLRAYAHDDEHGRDDGRVRSHILLRVYAHDDEHDHIFLPVHDDDRGDGRILLCFHYDYVFHDTSVLLDLVCS